MILTLAALAATNSKNSDIVFFFFFFQESDQPRTLIFYFYKFHPLGEFQEIVRLFYAESLCLHVHTFYVTLARSASHLYKSVGVFERVNELSSEIFCATFGPVGHFRYQHVRYRHKFERYQPTRYVS